MALIDIHVPDIGDFDEVAVIELLVKPGDTVKAEQSLITVESDKASMEIPSSHAGVVKELKVKLGDKVKQGSVVLVLESVRARPAHPPRRWQPPLRLHRHLLLRPPLGRPRPRPRPASAAVPTSSATCSCSAPAPAAIRQPSAPPTSASRSCSSSATPNWAASA